MNVLNILEVFEGHNQLQAYELQRYALMYGDGYLELLKVLRAVDLIILKIAVRSSGLSGTGNKQKRTI
jgi:hypothetical protein